MYAGKLQVNQDSGNPGKDPKNCFFIWNEPIGVLQLSTNPSDLEGLLAGIKLSEEGVSIELSRPPLQKEPVIFLGVKRIEPVPGLKDEDYLWKPDYIKIVS
ncbi:hypothetical protein HYW20_04715 [Candidatus Woesearchaeota archaeon]|nr:hypothetical protein [Candidatus Woesearchaeota archaeon]